MKMKKVLIIMALVIVIMGITSIKSLAATFNLDVAYDGKKVSLSSEDLSLDSLRLLPGETDTSYININNKAKEKVKLYMTAEVIDDQDLLQILEISIKDSKDKELYKGGYDDFEKVEIDLDKSATEKITIKTTLPETAGNEFQNKQANIKFDFEAEVEEPEVPEQPTTNQSRIIIYSILVVIVLALIVILIILSLNKRRKEKDSK